MFQSQLLSQIILNDIVKLIPFVILKWFARFGSDELKREFLAPSIAGDVVACLGVSETESGSDVASKMEFIFVENNNN